MTDKLNKAVTAFQKKYPAITSADMQTFVLGWQARESYIEPKIQEKAMPIAVKPEVADQRAKNMGNQSFLSGEAYELHEFLNERKVPQFYVDGSILPLIDRVIFYRLNK